MHKIARVYMRVSTVTQDLERQEQVIEQSRKAGYYVAGVYREKASGARADRPELLRMIGDLQPGEVVIAERMDRISRLPLKEAEKLVESIKGKGAKLCVPGVLDLTDLAAESTGVAKIVLDAMQDLLLKLALHEAHENWVSRRETQRQGIDIAKRKNIYTGKKPNTLLHERILALRSSKHTISETARLCKCSESLVKLVCKKKREEQYGE